MPVPVGAGLTEGLVPVPGEVICPAPNSSNKSARSLRINWNISSKNPPIPPPPTAWEWTLAEQGIVGATVRDWADAGVAALDEGVLIGFSVGVVGQPPAARQ